MPKRFIYRVQWSSGEDFSAGTHRDFDSHDDLLIEVSRLVSSGIPFVWMFQVGKRDKSVYSSFNDSIHFWCGTRALKAIPASSLRAKKPKRRKTLARKA